MEALTIKEVAKLAGAVSAGGGERNLVSGVSTDSRTIVAGDLFVALRGDRFDGHRFLEVAAEQGAAGLLVEAGAAVPPAIPVVRVADTRAALLSLAAGYRARFAGLTAVAVTGSVGKTTTKDVIAHLSAGERTTIASQKSFNNGVGVPLTVLAANRATEVLVAELGASEPGSIDRLAGAVGPDVGVITCVREAHLEGFGSIETIRAAKGELLRHVRRVAILNADDQATVWFRSVHPGRILTFGQGRDADVRIVRVVESETDLAFRIDVAGRRIEGRVPLVGRHQIGAVAAGLAVAWEIGLDLHRAGERLATFQGAPGRMRRISAGPVLLYDDCYNASPAAVREAIGFVCRRVDGRPIVLVLGDMLELGAESEAIHRRLGREVGEKRISRIVAVGPMARALAEEARRASHGRLEIACAGDALEAARTVGELVEAGDCVLVKGSRGIGLERVVDAVQRLFRVDGWTRRVEAAASR